MVSSAKLLHLLEVIIFVIDINFIKIKSRYEVSIFSVNIYSTLHYHKSSYLLFVVFKY